MDQEKIEELAFRVVGDMGGAFVMAQGYLGDRLGLFKAMAGAGPLSSEELAKKTGLNERYVREWAKAMVSAEYIDQDPKTREFVMTDVQSFVLADEDSPMFVGGAFQFTTPSMYNVPKIAEAFKNGGGISYHEIGEEIPPAIERFFRPGYKHFLAKDWIGAIPGMVERLQEGGSVADVGCGCGQSTIHMAKAFPKSQFLGIDYSPASITRAKKLGEEEGLSNIEWKEASAEEIPKDGKFDLICSFDCIHDMVHPRDVLRAIREALSPDGVYLWSEPNATHDPLENRNPLGRTFFNISPVHCMTVSLAHGGEGLGTVIGEKGVRELADSVGFSKVEKLPIENPFNQFFALAR